MYPLVGLIPTRLRPKERYGAAATSSLDEIEEGHRIIKKLKESVICEEDAATAWKSLPVNSTGNNSSVNFLQFQSNLGREACVGLLSRLQLIIGFKSS